jgi:hypothetical protein
MMPGMRHFELLDDLREGDSAPAVLLKWNGRRYIRTDERVQIYDFVGQHGHRGDRGYGFLSGESGLWEVASGLHEQTMYGVGA